MIVIGISALVSDESNISPAHARNYKKCYECEFFYLVFKSFGI